MSSNRIKSEKIQVGDNFILPIEQSKVTAQQAKVQKIIEETDAKARGIINNAENKAQVVLQTANTEAERIINDARKKAQQEYEKIKMQAYDEGFQKGEQDGLYKFQNDAVNGLKSLYNLVISSFDLKKNIIDSASLDIVELISIITDKVCKVKFNNEILHNLTLEAIKQLKEKENITIIVNPKLVDNITELMPTFRDEIPKIESIKIVEDNSLSPDGVIVETLNSRLDSRISSQIAEITQKMLTGMDNELEQE